MDFLQDKASERGLCSRERRRQSCFPVCQLDILSSLWSSESYPCRAVVWLRSMSPDFVADLCVLLSPSSPRCSYVLIWFSLPIFFMKFIFASFSTSAAILCILKNFTCIKHPSRRSTNGSRKFYIGWAGQKVLTRGIVMIFYKTESYMYHWAIIYTEPKATILLNYYFFV